MVCPSRFVPLVCMCLPLISLLGSVGLNPLVFQRSRSLLDNDTGIGFRDWLLLLPLISTCHLLQRVLIDAAAQVALVGEYGGLDTTWGHQELRTLSVMIADLDMQEVEGMTSVVEHLPSGELESKVLRRRAYTIPYTTLLSAGSVTEVQDTEVTVVPARGETPFAFAQLVNEIA